MLSNVYITRDENTVLPSLLIHLFKIKIQNLLEYPVSRSSVISTKQLAIKIRWPLERNHIHTPPPPPHGYSKAPNVGDLALCQRFFQTMSLMELSLVLSSTLLWIPN